MIRSSNITSGIGITILKRMCVRGKSSFKYINATVFPAQLVVAVLSLLDVII